MANHLVDDIVCLFRSSVALPRVRPNPPSLSVLVRVMVLRITCIVCIERMFSLHPKVFISL